MSTPDDGPVVLVTGGSSGIGRAAARRFSARGARVHLLARARGPLEDAAGECRAAGAASVDVHPVDVRDDVAVAGVVESLVARDGRLDVVLHSAGVAGYGRFEDIPPRIFEAVLATNVFGAANVMRSTLPVLRAQHRGTAVIVGSVLGDIAVPGMSPYVMSKFALRALARELVLENRDRPDVHVCLLTPGGVDTPIYQRAANVLGRPGRPPAPVQTADHVAARVLAVVDRPRPRADSGPANPLMRAGYTLLPRLFDAVVGPLYAVAALGSGTVAPTDGNALASTESGGQAVDGGHGQGAHDVATSTRRLLRGQRLPSGAPR